MKERVWVNFKELRSRLRFEDVLRLYKVEVKTKGEQHHGPCPLPNHTGSGTAPCFSANLRRGIFHCFGCGAKGNVLEFACLMERTDLKDGQAVRRVAVILQQRFFPEGASRRHPAPDRPVESEPEVPRRPEKPNVTAKPDAHVLVNEPIDFELKGLDRNHEYFARNGITTATAEYFGLGYCTRGMLKDRIAVPLHDAGGRLIGYGGMLVDDSRVCPENPLYRFPTKRERNGRVQEFDRSAFLYNGHRLRAPCDEIVVVEHFPSVWWLHQCGMPNSVALMGSANLDIQTGLIVSALAPSGRVWLLPSGDTKGGELASKLLSLIAPHRFVRWIRLEGGRQPRGIGEDELRACFVA